MSAFHLASVLLVLAAVTASGLVAQAPVRCGTMDHHAQLLAADPGYAARLAAIDAHARAFMAAGGPPAGEDVVRRIPVVVHVVWNTPAQNLSDQQVQSQIQVLTEDFRRLNADAGNTLAQFQGVAADAEFEFCLAALDPLGNPTTGITRTQTSVTVFSQSNDDVKFNATGGRDAWPRDQYLNLWVCNLGSGLLGYAQFPGGPAATDGVVLESTAFGRQGSAVSPFNLGRTCTHEVGHWLNLRHIWGDNQPLCGDDQVADTPPADGPHTGCAITATSCGGLNMVQNYMDYSDDSCLNLFTFGQKTRMQALFAAGGARVALLSSPACSPPAPLWQVNQPISTLTVNGVAGTAIGPAITSVVTGTPVTVAFQSNAAGRPWDTIFSFSATVASNVGGFVTGGGQVINLNGALPFFFLNSGTPSPLLLPFPGNLNAVVTPTVTATVSVQQLMVTPTLPDGAALSQACQLTVSPPSSLCTVTLPAGPNADDTSVTATLTGAGGCSVPVAFYGTSYTQFHVSSNGRVTFTAPDTAYASSVSAAAAGVPFVGFWTDLDPSAGGTITLSRPVSTRFRIAWNNVPYLGESVGVTFNIEFDTQTSAVILDGLLGVLPNPQFSAPSTGQNQFFGISRGGGALNAGRTTFSPGTSGTAASATAMLYDNYTTGAMFGGLCASLLTPLNTLTFTPGAGGVYSWVGL